MKILNRCLLTLSANLLLTTPYTYAQSDDFQSLALEVATLAAEVGLMEDENEIENLQRIYGFYTDKKLWAQAAGLFADNGSIEIGGSGVYVGKARILAYLQSLGAEGPEEGVLNDHMMLQPIITVANDGTAQGRWQHFSQEAVLGESHHWGTGTYENTYIKEDGIWKIQSLHLYSAMRTTYDGGWAESALPRTSPSESLPPDLPPSVDYNNYPDVYSVPFHYENPASAKSSDQISTIQSSDNLAEEVKSTLATLDKRLGLLQDADDVEYLHGVYGYYLSRYDWDELAGIFADDGTIEIALRGVYRGRPSVRNNLNLYNEPPGRLHNHMQYQPVIHINEDGQTAQMRSRAFSMMGGYEGAAMWMGGVYENQFVKRDGVWQISVDRVFNTYFTPYNTGWKDAVWRAAPGITDSNPPDEPPSSNFEMYPKAFLPPFHYVNPVTGR